MCAAPARRGPGLSDTNIQIIKLPLGAAALKVSSQTKVQIVMYEREMGYPLYYAKAYRHYQGEGGGLKAPKIV